MLLEHYMACVWQYLSPKSVSDTTAATSALELYVQNYYYVVLLVHGQSVETANVAQTIYSISVVFIGSFIVAIVFGNAAMLVSNFNSSATNYQRNMEKVFATMKKMQLPSELQDRIHQFFTHLWQEYDSVDADLVKFPKELTPTLALEVRLCQYMNLITGVPYWKDCSPDFVSQVIRNLVVRVYLPDDFVLRQREISQDLFMINRGTCERTHPLPEAESLDLRTMSATFGSRQTSSSTSPPKPLHSPPKKNSKYRHSVRETADSSSSPYSSELLRSGQVFGGMGLLLNFEQHFNVRAVTHVEMCVLSRCEFQKILMRFYHDRPIVFTALLEHVILKNELPFSMEDMFDVTVVDGDESLNEEQPARKSDSTSSTPRADLNTHASQKPLTRLTPPETVHFLMKKINHQVVDPTIKFGFQQVDLPPESPKAPDGCARQKESSSTAPEQASAATTQQQPPSSARVSLSSRSNSPSAVVAPNELSEHTPSTQPAEQLSGFSLPGHTECQLTSPLALESANADSLSGLPEVGRRRKHSSGHRHQSSRLPVVVGSSNEQSQLLQDEMQLLFHRAGEIEGSQVSVLSALEGLQQSVARINQNILALTTKPVLPGGDRLESRALRQERSMRKILSLPSHWEQSSQGAPQFEGEESREQTQSGRPRSGFRLRPARRLPRSQTGLPVDEVVPAQLDPACTRSSVQPFIRRASMFPRCSANAANRPPIVKKRELLADSLWTQYLSAQ